MPFVGPHSTNTLYTIETLVGRDYQVTGYAWAGDHNGVTRIHYFCSADHPESAGLYTSSYWKAGGAASWDDWNTLRQRLSTQGPFVYIVGEEVDVRAPTAQDTWLTIKTEGTVARPLERADWLAQWGLLAPTPQIFQGYTRVRERRGADIGTLITMFGAHGHSIEVWTMGDDANFPRGDWTYMSYMAGWPTGEGFNDVRAQRAVENTWIAVRADSNPMRRIVALTRYQNQLADQ